MVQIRDEQGVTTNMMSAGQRVIDCYEKPIYCRGLLVELVIPLQRLGYRLIGLWGVLRERNMLDGDE
jgi:hypothetical protein